MELTSTAILIHEVNNNHESHLSVVVHDVDTASDIPRLGPGRPLNASAKADIVATLNDDLQDDSAGFINARTLMQSPQTLVWYRPAAQTMIRLHSQEVTIPMPSLVFVAHRGGLWVSALESDQRPEPSDGISHSGLPNINDSGHWCTGGNQIPEQPRNKDIEDIETMFFESPFTHPSGNRVMPDHVTGENWVETFLELEGVAEYPFDTLNERHVSLMQWIRRITK
ncbi:PRTRC system protein B [Marinobacter halodurans]|uniref:PRTRC system protein B n=1 Tax=Marinobacter halodurans TaxID=2528979 RepID=A0ABY1ZMT6_9GAMM|nr:PRTRC system protein B [Marinobacter halodurans]TBW57481.1 PRTRC system protein B [Marinobacter halodurans]